MNSARFEFYGYCVAHHIVNILERPLLAEEAGHERQQLIEACKSVFDRDKRSKMD
jgi:hypothetical protein